MMKEFENCLRKQLHDHRSMQPQDVVKLCYQAAYGAEHLLSDENKAKEVFDHEYDAIPTTSEPLFELISPKICRVNLGAWKQTEMPSEWLFRMFCDSMLYESDNVCFSDYLNTAEEVLYRTGYDLDIWRQYRKAYQNSGCNAVRHTERYREKERPAYRIVRAEYMRLLPLLKKIHSMPKLHETFVIAIDGKAGAGKSALAELLRKVLDAGIVYMDDFFLPPYLRSEDRLRIVGGNVHYERFAEQVVPYLNSTQTFCYDRFDCSMQDYGEQRVVFESYYKIVEGSYSHHPHLTQYMDIRVFMDVREKEQLQRIRLRDGEALAKIFQEQWIPLEKRYFEEYCIKEHSNVDYL